VSRGAAAAVSGPLEGTRVIDLTLVELKDRYRRGAVGDVEVKQKLAAALNTFLDPIRERRAHYAANMGLVRDALAVGSDRARKTAQTTMALVREALDLGYLERFRGS